MIIAVFYEVIWLASSVLHSDPVPPAPGPVAVPPVPGP